MCKCVDRGCLNTRALEYSRVLPLDQIFTFLIMRIFIHNIQFQLLGIAVILFVSCNNNNPDKGVSEPELTEMNKPTKKPASTSHDTLLIVRPAVVLYHPDTFQLQQIKSQTDSMLYDGMMHDFFYQMRNARAIIKKNWPSLSIVESRNFRYILFKKDSSHLIIDLDTKTDPYGLIIFNTKKDPIQVDMTNLETGISFYLK